jgi:MFS family permease
VKESSYKKYLLTILLLILAFNFVDRFALGILLQDIKSDLVLSDTQLGFMSGIAFAFFYSVMGIPIARWADRGNRVTVISLTTAVWSVMVALCGMAGSFLQLLVFRIGVGIGEAGCIPAGNSLIADYFARPERPRAAAIYALGTSLGFIVGYLLAGWLNAFYGWRLTFLLLGSPGLVLAILARLTLREPRSTGAIPLDVRGDAVAAVAQQEPAPDLKTIFVILWRNKTFRHLVAGLSVIYFYNYGILQWQPAFFIRSYGLTSGELGTWFAVTYGVSGILGTYCGGALATRYAPLDERTQLSAAAIVHVILGIINPFCYFLSNYYWTFAVLGLLNFGGSVISGPYTAVIQTLMPARLRAVSLALAFLFANLIGMGLGPLAVGILSDSFRSWAKDESLRYALVALTPGYFWAAWHLWLASRNVTQDLLAAYPIEPYSVQSSGVHVVSGSS